MPSKRSSFNRTLFRKNLTRFWPLWGGATLLGCLAPLYLLLTLVSMPWAEVSALDFAALLYSAVTTLVPGITLVYAILCAMAVWGYLYTGRSVGLMHALPIDRTGLFLTSTLSGLAMMLIPYAVVGGLSCLVALGGGFMDVVAVLYTAAAVVLLSVLFSAWPPSGPCAPAMRLPCLCFIWWGTFSPPPRRRWSAALPASFFSASAAAATGC